MTTLKIEWTGSRQADDAEVERGLAAANAAIDTGVNWLGVLNAFHGALTQGWVNPTAADNYTLTTQELTAAVPMMDDEIREDIHDDDRAADPIWFLAEYQRRHADKFGEPFAFA